jgi:ribosomal protein L16 Arg81 hydroxylase
MKDAKELITSSSSATQFTFASLVEPLGIETFMRDYQGKQEWIHHGRPDRFEWLLSWQSLNTLIRDHRPSFPRFRLMKAGHPVPEGNYHRTIQTLRGPLRQLDPPRLHAELREGATLVWDAIDQAYPPIRAAKQAMERALRAFMFVNMYASWGSIGGFGDHWDDHDVFVLQVIGRKNWHVRPASMFNNEPPVEPMQELQLRAGSVLYLPRGWWHRVTPINEPSLHLTIGVLRPTNADFLLWLLDKSKQSDLIGEDFPFEMDDNARTKHAAALRLMIEDWIQPSNISLYEQDYNNEHYLDPMPTLEVVGEANLNAWDADSEVIFLSTRAHLQNGDREDVILMVAGTQWRLPKKAEHLLNALINGQRVQIRVLLQCVSGNFLMQLVNAGIIALV